jgi:hypothetical protein
MSNLPRKNCEPIAARAWYSATEVAKVLVAARQGSRVKEGLIATAIQS